jgi:protein kinase-like protein
VPPGSDPRDLPTAIGRYRIIGRLSPDPRNEVYKGFDPLIERPLVVKIFPLGSAAGSAADEIRRTFYAEMQRTGMLTHPGITTLFDAGELPGGLFMATEYIDGQSLAERLEAGLDLDVRGRVALFLQLADALEYARAQGVLHLNLQPSNVLVGADYALKIRGFGVTRVIDALAGTAPSSRWTAPERAAGEVGDGRSDVYSLARIVQDLLGAMAPAETTAVLARAIAPNPSERFEDATALKYALLLSLGLDELDVRLGWESSREMGSIISAERVVLGLPQRTVPADATPDSETLLTPSGAEEPAVQPAQPPGPTTC